MQCSPWVQETVPCTPGAFQELSVRSATGWYALHPFIRCASVPHPQRPVCTLRNALILLSALCIRSIHSAYISYALRCNTLYVRSARSAVFQYNLHPFNTLCVYQCTLHQVSTAERTQSVLNGCTTYETDVEHTARFTKKQAHAETAH